MLATHDPTLDRDRPHAWPRASAGRPTTSSSRCSTASAPTSSSGWPGWGTRMRVYVPYGDDWYGYLIRRLAERPANLGFFARSLVTKN